MIIERVWLRVHFRYEGLEAPRGQLVESLALASNLKSLALKVMASMSCYWSESWRSYCNRLWDAFCVQNKCVCNLLCQRFVYHERNCWHYSNPGDEDLYHRVNWNPSTYIRNETVWNLWFMWHSKLSDLKQCLTRATHIIKRNIIIL